MEQVQLSDLLNKLENIEKQLVDLKKEVNENEQLLIELLKTNNKQTKHIYEATIKDKSSEQQAKDFLMNVVANIAGNTIATPTLLNIK